MMALPAATAADLRPQQQARCLTYQGADGFWSYRKLDLSDNDTLQLVAKYDDESPLLIQQSVGEGTIFVLTTGWQPSQSGLALSTKFLPILSGMSWDLSNRLDGNVWR